jgi:hypothetical protein
MKRLFLSFFLVVSTNICFSQNNETIANSSNAFRINIINPGIEFESKVTRKTSLSINFGVGYGGSYKNLSSDATGWLYMYAPFMDIHYKYIYNLDKRLENGQNTKFNTGNFFGFRFLARGKEFGSNFNRTTNIDYAFGPTFGLQRSYNRIHILFDLGLNYYFDGKGNNGITPMLELNIGYNLLSR